MTIKVYSTPTCPWCKKVRSFLEKENIHYTDIDVSADQDKAEEMINLTGQMGVPVIARGKQFVIGYDEKAIKELIK